MTKLFLQRAASNPAGSSGYRSSAITFENVGMSNSDDHIAHAVSVAVAADGVGDLLRRS